MRWFLFFGFLCVFGVLGLGACEQVTAKTCAADSDCGAGLICLGERCITGCRNSTSCDKGSFCLGNTCQTITCLPGSSRSCYGASVDTEGRGVCRPGIQYCNDDGTFGACSGALLPQAESCDGYDNDCNGQVDDGLSCACTPGKTQSCYVAASATIGKGLCRAGTQTCGQNNQWGPCKGQVVPSPEICDGKDNDCNGLPDDGLFCKCIAGATRVCYPAPLTTINIGVCRAGTQTCQDDGSWTTCSATVPLVESCDGLDNDCNGKVDDGLPCPKSEPDAGSEPLPDVGLELPPETMEPLSEQPQRDMGPELPPEQPKIGQPPVIFGGTKDDKITAIQTDAKGNIYVAGAFGGQITFAGKVHNPPKGYPHAGFVAKYDATGTELWLVPFSALNGLKVNALTLTASENGVIVVGCHKGSVSIGSTDKSADTKERAYALQVKADGSPTWDNVLQLQQGGDTCLNDVSIGSNGAVLVTGWATGSVTLKGVSQSSNGSKDVLLGRLQADGGWDILKLVGGTKDDEGQAIYWNGSQVIIAGSFLGSIRFFGAPGFTITARGTLANILFIRASADFQYTAAGPLGEEMVETKFISSAVSPNGLYLLISADNRGRKTSLPFRNPTATKVPIPAMLRSEHIVLIDSLANNIVRSAPLPSGVSNGDHIAYEPGRKVIGLAARADAKRQVFGLDLAVSPFITELDVSGQSWRWQQSLVSVDTVGDSLLLGYGPNGERIAAGAFENTVVVGGAFCPIKGRAGWAPLADRRKALIRGGGL